MNSIEWLHQLPIFLALVGLIYLPGIAVCALAGVRDTYLLPLAPLVSLSLVSALSILFEMVGVQWSFLTFAGATVIVCVIALGVGKRWRYGREYSVHISPMVWICGLLAWIAHVLPAIIAFAPYTPIQQDDSTYHMNLVWFMNRTGDASSLTAPTRMFGMDTSQTIAPSGWHALLSLVGNDVVRVTNTMSLVVPLIWVIGISLLAYMIFCADIQLVFFSQVVTVIFTEFPTVLQSTYPIFPNTLTIAVLPYAITTIYVVVMDIREHSLSSLQVAAICGAGVFVLLGLAIIHPSIILNVAAICALPIFYGIVLLIRRAPRGKRMKCFASLGDRRCRADSVCCLSFGSSRLFDSRKAHDVCIQR